MLLTHIQIDRHHTVEGGSYSASMTVPTETKLLEQQASLLVHELVSYQAFSINSPSAAYLKDKFVDFFSKEHGGEVEVGFILAGDLHAELENLDEFDGHEIVEDDDYGDYVPHVVSFIENPDGTKRGTFGDDYSKYVLYYFEFHETNTDAEKEALMGLTKEELIQKILKSKYKTVNL